MSVSLTKSFLGRTIDDKFVILSEVRLKGGINFSNGFIWATRIYKDLYEAVPLSGTINIATIGKELSVGRMEQKTKWMFVIFLKSCSECWG